MARSTRRNPLADWLKSALSDPDKEHSCSVLMLVREVKGTEEEVHTVRFTQGQQWKPDELSERFYNIAKEDCKDDKGVEHKYRLNAYYGKDTPEASKRFSLSPYGEDIEYINDAPTAQGALAQGMRLTEQLIQGSFKILAQTTGSLAADNMNLRDKLDKANDMLLETSVKLQQAQNDQRMKELEFARASEERKQWLTMVPLLMNTILGKEIFPQSAIDTKIIEAAAEHLSQEDIQALAAKLPPHLWGPLASRFEKFLKEKVATDERIKALAQAASNPDPEADAAGD